MSCVVSAGAAEADPFERSISDTLGIQMASLSCDFSRVFSNVRVVRKPAGKFRTHGAVVCPLWWQASRWPWRGCSQISSSLGRKTVSLQNASRAEQIKGKRSSKSAKCKMIINSTYHFPSSAHYCHCLLRQAYLLNREGSLIAERVVSNWLL